MLTHDPTDRMPLGFSREAAVRRSGNEVGDNDAYEPLTYMHGQTLRIAVAVVAVGVVVAVLSALVVESRTVTNEYIIAHAERMRAAELSADDIETVRSGLETAFRDGSGVAPAVELALARLGENGDRLQDLSDIPNVATELSSRLETYAGAAQAFTDSGREFIERQNDLAGALARLQEESASLVKHLRDLGLANQAQQVFVLAIEVLEFAGDENGAEDALKQRIGTVAGIADVADTAGSSTVPETSARLRSFVAAAEEPLAMRTAAAAALDALRVSGFDGELSALRQDLAAANSAAVSRAERARLLLAVCAAILLVATAYAVIRLQFSYNELNRTNVRLEENVQQRTEQLSKAYSELKESQVQLIHAEKMSSLGEMVAGISHEINTPLWYLMNNSSVIQERLQVMGRLCDVADTMLGAVRTRDNVNQVVGRGLVEMNRLMKDGIKDDVEEAQDLVQDSIDGLNELTTLAQSLKGFSRLDRAERDEFDINEGLERTLLIAKNKLKNKAEVHTHYGDISPVLCSPSQINQIFLNLLTNAADAIPERGEIVLHTSENDGIVEISVSDNGTGIPEEHLSKIRDPFFTTKEVGKGTGLGLSIVDRIVAEHGGELRIESEVGYGTTVVVALPTGKPEAPEAGAEDDEAAIQFEPGVLYQSQTERPQHVGGSLSA